MTWFVQPLELRDAVTGGGTGIFHLVASSDEGGGTMPCCAHDHRSPAEASACEEAIAESERVTGLPARRPAPVVDISAVREARAQEDAEAAHARGEAFAFTLRDDLGADDAPVGHADGVVTILLDGAALTGIALSPDAARRLGVALIECAALAVLDVASEGP